MKILSWIEKKKLTRREAAEKFGMSQAQLSRLITGARTPSSAQVAKITTETGGMVTFADFFEDVA